jgi:Asp/Glu/hydantoin racemase
MRLLVINPNTTESITLKVAACVRAMVPQACEVEAITAAFGPRYIASRAAFAIASHASLDAFARHGAGADAILLACFGDPGLDALREVASVPVIGLVEAAGHEASAGGRRYAIVTGGERWGPMLEEMLRLRNLDGSLAAIRTIAPSGAAIAADPDGSIAMLAQACESVVKESGAQAVILGGAGLVGLAARVQPYVSAPVICSVEAGVRAALASLTGRVLSGQAPLSDRVDSVGLSAALAALMRNEQA